MQTELIEAGDGRGGEASTPWGTIRRSGLERSLEALLFVASEALSIDRLVKLTGASHVEVAETLGSIAEAFAERGIVLREVAGGYRFATSPAAREAVEAYLLPAKTNLSPAAMETLAIVAYLQPATRAEIEAVRGVNVDSVVSTLTDRRFIAEAGRRDVPGRPMEYATTPDFLEAFGLRSLAELPPVDLEAEARELTLPIATEIAPVEIRSAPADVAQNDFEESKEETAGAAIDAAPAEEGALSNSS